MTEIKKSLLSYIREQSVNVRVADRTEIETDAGTIIRYEIWYMNAEHILRGYIEIPIEAESLFRTEENLPMEHLRDYLNNL